MSVVGFDLGTLNTVIAVVRSGGVDVICNEVSDRTTPSMVSFDAKRRYAGDAARTQEVGNLRNTVANLPRLIGRFASEPAIGQMEAGFLTCPVTEREGLVAARVSYRGEERSFSSVELMGMFLDKLKSITFDETKLPVSDVVISLSPFHTEKERRALIDAAEVAGLNCLCVLSDTTAAAICYGMSKGNMLPEGGAPRIVAIVDIGHGSLKACVGSFVRGRVEIKAQVFDSNLGGRNFDEVLVGHFVEQFAKQRKGDLAQNTKALLRLRIACERLRRMLSGIPKARLELEAILDGQDFVLELTREQFEQLTAPLLDRIEEKMRELLSIASLPIESIEAVETIGGCTRIPAVKARISAAFGKDISTTLNQDEAVSRGCALLCAMESPLVKVRDFKVIDTVTFPIKFVWADPRDGQSQQMELFPRGTPTNLVRSLYPPSVTLPLTLEAHYSDLSAVPLGTPSQLAKYTISAHKGLSLGGAGERSSKIRVDALINSSGLLEIKAAYLIQELVEDSQQHQEGAMPTEGEASPTPKVFSKETSLKVTAETFSLPRSVVQRMKEAEIDMSLTDRQVAEIDDRRNALEEYIYDMRAKLDGPYERFTLPEERDRYMAILADMEEWLYGEGADTGKEEYNSKLAELQKITSPVLQRVRKEEEEKRRIAEEAEAAAKAEKNATQSSTTDASSENSSIQREIPNMDVD